jgi:hypothetical protein
VVNSFNPIVSPRTGRPIRVHIHIDLSPPFFRFLLEPSQQISLPSSLYSFKRQTLFDRTHLEDVDWQGVKELVGDDHGKDVLVCIHSNSLATKSLYQRGISAPLSLTDRDLPNPFLEPQIDLSLFLLPTSFLWFTIAYPDLPPALS